LYISLNNSESELVLIRPEQDSSRDGVQQRMMKTERS
jgi:hypothetical protein